MKFVEEGDKCPECEGIMYFPKVEGCSCHISPPCHACVSNKLTCNSCGYEVEEEPFNDHIMQVRKEGIYTGWKLRELDKTKIDWHSFSHTNSSMIKEGVYPEGTDMSEVRKLVDGTFGGRFEYFGNGKFKFIAYTD